MATWPRRVAWPRVLDLYAGSGALGIEALSRGAAFAAFVEQDRAAARVISANLRSTDLEDGGHVIVAPVQVALARVDPPIDLVFADPPYAETSRAGGHGRPPGSIETANHVECGRARAPNRHAGAANNWRAGGREYA